MNRRRFVLLVLLVVTVALALVFHERVGIAFAMVERRLIKKTIADRLTQFGAVARDRMKGDFSQARVSYPPNRLTLLVLKEERRVEIYAGSGGDMRFIRAYPILATSGTAGPKLREGDNQVPEGIYQIESLNPNSAYHVSLRLNYPNAFDREQAKNDGRTNLGGDIMIHGKAVSIGCVAIGDPAAEDIFTLADDTGLKNIAVVCSPIDFRKQSIAPRQSTLPPWSSKLYAQLKSALSELPVPSK